MTHRLLTLRGHIAICLCFSVDFSHARNPSLDSGNFSKPCKVGLMTRANVPSNGYPQIIEDASHGSLQSVFVRHPSQRYGLPAARSAALGVQPSGINFGLSGHLSTGAVWADMSPTTQPQTP